MSRIIGNIPLLDLMSFLIETADAPTHVGGLQIFQPINGGRAEIVQRLLQGFRKAEVGPPFSYHPIFPAIGWPKWASCDAIDCDYHIRHAALPAPGNEQQLIERVMDLHAGLMDRSRPGWIAYVIEGLEQDRFAVYWKVHHAYIDGTSAIMRLEEILTDSPDDLRVQPIWGPLHETVAGAPDSAAVAKTNSIAKEFYAQLIAWRDVGLALGRNLLQAGGWYRSEGPLPFSAPHTLFNQAVHATRHLGVASVELSRFRRISKSQEVSINELALMLVGEALERYARRHDQVPEKALVAVCPLSIREPGDSTASTQIAAISVKLGAPGSALVDRLQQVHASSRDAKAEAGRMSRNALVNYLILLGGTADLLAKTPLAAALPALTNVNVSNVIGPSRKCYLGGAELIRSYPVSTLAGGTAVNITFNSFSGRMDYAVVSDAASVPHAQEIADEIGAVLEQLETQLDG